MCTFHLRCLEVWQIFCCFDGLCALFELKEDAMYLVCLDHFQFKTVISAVNPRARDLCMAHHVAKAMYTASVHVYLLGPTVFLFFVSTHSFFFFLAHILTSVLFPLP